jgi:hypothetical protein
VTLFYGERLRGAATQFSRGWRSSFAGLKNKARGQTRANSFSQCRSACVTKKNIYGPDEFFMAGGWRT